MIEKFRIKSQRQRRAIIVLLDRDNIEVKDLGTLIGALNPRQIIFELRQQGFGEVIKTKFFGRIDQDDKHCRPGKYFIPSECKSIIQEFLKKDGLTAAQTKPQNVNQGSDNYDKEEA